MARQTNDPAQTKSVGTRVEPTDKPNKRLPSYWSEDNHPTFVVNADNAAAILSYIDARMEMVIDQLPFLQ